MGAVNVQAWDAVRKLFDGMLAADAEATGKGGQCSGLILFGGMLAADADATDEGGQCSGLLMLRI